MHRSKLLPTLGFSAALACSVALGACTSDGSGSNDRAGSEETVDETREQEVAPTTAARRSRESSTTVTPTTPATTAAPSTAAPTTAAPTTVATTDSPETSAPTDTSATTVPATAEPSDNPSTTVTSVTSPTSAPARDEVQVAVFTEWIVITAVDDDLNVREEPSADAKVVGTLAHLTGGITNDATAVRGANGSLWLKISAAGVADGWVNSKFLAKQAPLPTAACVADPNFPAGTTAISTTQADVDGDGALDTIDFSADLSGATLSDDAAWFRVTFANGGVADGHHPGFELTPTGTNSLAARNMHHVGDFTLELVVAVGVNSSGINAAVMVLDGCTWVPATGDAPLVNHGSVGTLSAWGCEFGAHGEVEVTTLLQDNNAGTWSIDSWHLVGTNWTNVGTLDGINTNPPSAIQPCAPGF